MSELIRVPNEQALRDGVANAELDLNQWDQSTWASEGDDETCGTTACLAGHILLASGMTWGEVLDLSERDGRAVPMQAMTVLGFEVPRPEGWWDPGPVANFVGRVFGFTIDPNADDDATEEEYAIAFGPDKMKLLKERITEVTGIEF
jgi:hypothetical protein